MGRFLGKCKGTAAGGESIAVVGVRTRARAASAMAASSGGASVLPEMKIRKLSASSTRYNNVNELRKRRRATVLPEKSVSSVSCLPETPTTADCSTGEICSDFPASCCSSNNPTISRNDDVKDRLGITADPEVGSPETRCFDYCRATRRERKSGAPNTDDQDSPPRRPDAKSTAQIKMPSDSEIEEFFSTAEKDLHKRFTDKYNFDVVKDVPVEGRYEWVPLKP